MQQHRPRVPGRDSRRPQAGGLRPGAGLSGPRPGCLCRLRGPGSRGLRLSDGRLRLRRGRQRLLHVRPAQPAQHRGLVHPQPPRDLGVPHPGRPPRPRLLPRRLAGLPGPAWLADQARRPLPQRPLVQRRHIIRRQPHHCGDRRAAVPQLPQRRDRDVPHRRVVLGVPEQLPRPGEDHRLAAAVQEVQVTCIRHAIQDGSSGSRHTPTLPLFNILCKELHTVTAGHGHNCRRSGSCGPERVTGRQEWSSS